MTTNLDVALALARAGLPIFPADVRYNGAKDKWEKTPRIKGWQENATTDEKTLRSWWGTWSDAVPGIELGRAGLVVIDTDRHGGPDGVSNFAALVEQNVPLCAHPVAVTAGGGEHHYFRRWPGETFGNSEGALGDKGINVRGKGGWTVAPGAVRPDGQRWQPAGLSAAYASGTIPRLPDWVAAKIRQPKRHAEGAKSWPDRESWSATQEARVRDALKFVPSDRREIWLRVGAALHWTGWPQARATWDDWSRTSPGAFDEADQEKTWASFDRPFGKDPVTLATLFHLAREHGQPTTTSASGEGVSLDSFRAYMPQHNYIYEPTGEFWPASSVNAKLPPMPLPNDQGGPLVDDSGKPKTIAANVWLDRNRSVEQLTWAPGEPRLISNRVISEGGWIEQAGVTCYNQYRPPNIKHGDSAAAGRWVDHVRRVYGEDADHIIKWLAHRVQRPHEKTNHALVLGGYQGIGKDTLLAPVMQAIGPWNVAEVSPQQMLGRFNGFAKSVIARVSEARDLGDIDRFKFYDHMKVYTAAPPEMLRVDEKHLREHNVLNCVGIIITTNYKTDGIYLPPDDRRHFVAWSDLKSEDFDPGYFNGLHEWFAAGGNEHVAAYLAQLDLSSFDPKAPPLKTPAFWAIVDASRAPEDAEMKDVLDSLRNPDVVTLGQIVAAAPIEYGEWLKDRRNRRQIPHRLEECDYVAVRNQCKDGQWIVNGKRQAIYARKALTLRDRVIAAQRLAGR